MHNRRLTINTYFTLLGRGAMEEYNKSSHTAEGRMTGLTPIIGKREEEQKWCFFYNL